MEIPAFWRRAESCAQSFGRYLHNCSSCYRPKQQLPDEIRMPFRAIWHSMGALLLVKSEQMMSSQSKVGPGQVGKNVTIDCRSPYYRPL